MTETQTSKAPLSSAELARMMLETFLPQVLNKVSLPPEVRQQLLVEIEPLTNMLCQQNYQGVIYNGNGVIATARIAIAEDQLKKLTLPDNVRTELEAQLAEISTRLGQKRPYMYRKITSDAINLSVWIVNAADEVHKERVLERALQLYTDFEVMSPEDQIFLLSALASLDKMVSQNKHPKVDWTKVRDRMSLEYIERNLLGLAERVLDTKSVANFGKIFGKDLTRDLEHVAAARPQLVPRRVRKAERSTRDRSHLAAIGA